MLADETDGADEVDGKKHNLGRQKKYTPSGSSTRNG